MSLDITKGNAEKGSSGTPPGKLLGLKTLDLEKKSSGTPPGAAASSGINLEKDLVSAGPSGSKSLNLGKDQSVKAAEGSGLKLGKEPAPAVSEEGSGRSSGSAEKKSGSRLGLIAAALIAIGAIYFFWPAGEGEVNQTASDETTSGDQANTQEPASSQPETVQTQPSVDGNTARPNPGNNSQSPAQAAGSVPSGSSVSETAESANQAPAQPVPSRVASVIAEPEVPQGAQRVEERIQFASRSSSSVGNLDATSLNSLQAHVASGGSILIVGHASSEGNTQNNIYLSKVRADAVKKSLVAAGIPGASIKTQGAGALSPVADNATDEGRSQNRRAEIYLVGKP